MSSLQGQKIILGITGSISAYKSLILLRLLTKAGAEVQVIMTSASKDFVGPLSFSTLSGKPVLSDISTDTEWANHVQLGLWADLFIVAPASAQTLSKMAHGLVDNLLTAVYLSAKCPVMVAPAMDLDMWAHPATQSNILTLKMHGVHLIPVGEGLLASGLSGPGRLAEPEEIFDFVEAQLMKKNDLKSKRILITAGPTYEPLDPVRFIGNHSSGKMGIRLAEECLLRGAEVHLILGPTKEVVSSHKRLKITNVETAQQMYDQVMSHCESIDCFIMAAAVADYRPETVAEQKIKKAGDQISLQLVKNPDIAAAVGKNKRNDQKLIGFALETENTLENARLKLYNKNLDLVVLNTPDHRLKSGFGYDYNKVDIVFKNGQHLNFEHKSKKEVATDIINALLLL